MALSGVHVACGFAGGPGFGGEETIILARKPAWSQTMANAGTTTQGAPDNGTLDSGTGPYYGTPIFEVRSSVDVFVAIGATPDAVNGPRTFVPASYTRNIICDVGDKLAWIAA